ncbi:MAG: YicC/YloC family endoribonuclease [Edaphocola sp.]
MIYSMTGYGRGEGSVGGRQVMVEIKSLNGKQFEISSRFSPLLKAYEADIRNDLQKTLKRGTIDISITIKQDGAAKPMVVNTELAQYYYRAMAQIATELGLATTGSSDQIMATIMRMPEVVAAESDTLPEEDWQAIRNIIKGAAAHLVQHRSAEGQALQQDLANNIGAIEQLLAQVAPYEPERISRIRERIHGSLEEWVEKERIDLNRLEQELIFYIEKIDFSEEKQRLGTHCAYFTALMESGNEEGIGKKLGFVLQEVGREINTLGSKANDAAIQKIVVNMKDHLEKAKEQVLNAL